MKLSLGIVCFVLLFSLVLAELPPNLKYGNPLGSYLLGGTPRRNLKNKEVPSNFCAYTQQNGCDFQDYVESIGVLIIPGIVVGAVLFLGLIIYAIIKKCCCCNGNFRTSDVITLKIVIIVTTVMMGAVLIAAFVGNSQASKGGKGFVDNTINFAQEIIDITKNATDTLNEFPELSFDFSDTIRATQELVNTSRVVQSEFEKYENIRSKVFISAYVILIVMCALAIISCFVWLCISGHINFCLGLILILFMWLVFSITLALGNANTDICKLFDDEITAYEAGSGNSDILEHFLGQWGANCSAFAEILDQSVRAFDNYTNQFCNQYRDLCNNGAGIEGCSPCNQDTDFRVLVRTSYVSNYADCPHPQCISPCISGTCTTGNITIYDCATGCYSQTEKNAAAQAVNLANGHAAIKNLIALIRPYLGCQLIVLYIQRVYDPVCKQFLNGMELLVVASCLIGIILVAFNVEMLFSIERFDPNKMLPEDDDNEAWREGASEHHHETPKTRTWGTFTGTIGFIPSSTFVLDKGDPGTNEKGLKLKSYPSVRNMMPEDGYAFTKTGDNRPGIPNDFKSSEMQEKKGDGYG